LENDPEYARAYLGLAETYWTKHFWSEYFSEQFMDSVLILADKALSYDNHLDEAYYIRGLYFTQINKIDRAETEFEKALKYNPNYWSAYCALAENIYFNYQKLDFVKGLEYLHKAVSLHRGKQLPALLRELGSQYIWIAGFPEKAKYYINEAFELDGDTNACLFVLSDIERALRNYENSIELLTEYYASDSSNIQVLAWLTFDYYMLDKTRESLKYSKKIENRLKEVAWVYYSGMRRIGYVYWQNGYRKEAIHWFNEQKKVSEEALKMGRYYSIDANYDLAGMYAFLGDKKNAYKNLKEVSKINVCPLWLLSALKDEPLFNSIRNEPEFQNFVSDMETKYHREHERVRKWLESQGQL
jgi:tetratricopeptide (TPR) repeat protein